MAKKYNPPAQYIKDELEEAINCHYPDFHKHNIKHSAKFNNDNSSATVTFYFEESSPVAIFKYTQNGFWYCSNDWKD